MSQLSWEQREKEREYSYPRANQVTLSDNTKKNPEFFNPIICPIKQNSTMRLFVIFKRIMSSLRTQGNLCSLFLPLDPEQLVQRLVSKTFLTNICGIKS